MYSILNFSGAGESHGNIASQAINCGIEVILTKLHGFYNFLISKAILAFPADFKTMFNFCIAVRTIFHGYKCSLKKEDNLMAAFFSLMV